MKAQEAAKLLMAALTLVTILTSGWLLNGPPGALVSLTTFLITIYATSGFIFHVHDMPRRRDAFQAMFTFIFGLHYPVVEVAEGRVTEKSRGTPGAKLGGPGIVKVAEDSAAVLVRGRESRVIGPGTHTARRGERVKEAVDLRPQMRSGTVKAMTKDGFEVEVDFFVGFQIDPGRRAPTPEEPYPFAEQAVRWAVYHSKMVGKDGAQFWHEQVPDLVFGNVREMIATRYLEELFEPEKPGSDPRSKLKEWLRDKTQPLARSCGAQVNWVSFTTPKIPDEAARKYVEYYGAKLQKKIKETEAQAQQKAFETLVQAFDKLSPDDKVDQLVRVRFIEALEAIARDKTSTLVLPYDAIEVLRPSLSGRSDTRSLAAPSAEGQS